MQTKANFNLIARHTPCCDNLAGVYPTCGQAAGYRIQHNHKSAHHACLHAPGEGGPHTAEEFLSRK